MARAGHNQVGEEADAGAMIRGALAPPPPPQARPLLLFLAGFYLLFYSMPLFLNYSFYFFFFNILFKAKVRDVVGRGRGYTSRG